MIPLKELISTLDFYPEQINYHLDYLKKMKIDFDVYLPSLNMNLQRDLVWDIRQKQEIIWSMWMKRNIPRMAFVYTVDNIMQIIDGKQRLNAMFDYIDGKFAVTYNNKKYYYKDLSKDHQRHLSSYPLAAYIVYESEPGGITDKQKIDWFRFINFAGTRQDKDHLDKLNAGTQQ